MPVVDHERVLVRLKGEISKKASHGQRELLATIGRLEAECEVPEGSEVLEPVALRSLRRDGVKPVRSPEASLASGDAR